MATLGRRDMATTSKNAHPKLKARSCASAEGDRLAMGCGDDENRAVVSWAVAPTEFRILNRIVEEWDSFFNTNLCFLTNKVRRQYKICAQSEFICTLVVLGPALHNL